MSEKRDSSAASGSGKRNDAGGPTNPQKRDADEKPRDKPVEEEADKDIKQGAKGSKNA